MKKLIALCLALFLLSTAVLAESASQDEKGWLYERYNTEILSQNGNDAVDASTADDESVCGEWTLYQLQQDGQTYNAVDLGYDKIALQMNEDGTGTMTAVTGDVGEAGWYVEDGRLYIVSGGVAAKADIQDGFLNVDSDGTILIFSRTETEIATPTAEPIDTIDVVGDWYLNRFVTDGETYNAVDVGYEKISMQLNADGTGTAVAVTGESAEVSWYVENGQVTITHDDEAAAAYLEDGFLYLEDQGVTMIFGSEPASAAATPEPTEESTPEPTEEPTPEPTEEPTQAPDQDEGVQYIKTGIFWGMDAETVNTIEEDAKHQQSAVSDQISVLAYKTTKLGDYFTDKNYYFKDDALFAIIYEYGFSQKVGGMYDALVSDLDARYGDHEAAEDELFEYLDNLSEVKRKAVTNINMWKNDDMVFFAYILNGNNIRLAFFDQAFSFDMPEPTEEPTPEPTEEPTPEPTEEPTPEPTEEPTPEPTEEPTPEPTEEPTPEPTEEPTVEPTEEPTVEPTEEPTTEPTEEPAVVAVDTLVFRNGIEWGMTIKQVGNLEDYEGVEQETSTLWGTLVFPNVPVEGANTNLRYFFLDNEVYATMYEFGKNRDAGLFDAMADKFDAVYGARSESAADRAAAELDALMNGIYDPNGIADVCEWSVEGLTVKMMRYAGSNEGCDSFIILYADSEIDLVKGNVTTVYNVLGL